LRNSPDPRASIAFFLPTLGGGGAERNILRLAAGLGRLGHPILVIVASAGGPNEAWIPPDAELIDLHAGRVAKSVVPLARVLRERTPGVLVSALDEANLAALAARWWSGVAVPVVVTSRVAQSAGDAHARGLRARLVIPWLVRRWYRWADRIVSVSRAGAADLAQVLGLPPSRVVAIANPVLDEQLTRLQGEPLHHPWVADLGGAPLVVAVGRLAPQKDFPLLVRAFARARQSVPDARLAILGDGDERATLERLRSELALDDAVLLPGFQANPYAWMRRASVLALSSRFEGLPTVVIEGLACGARVVATDCPTGPDEILDHGRWGYLVPVGDVDAYAAALVEAMQQGRWTTPPIEALQPYTEAPVVSAFERLLQPLLRPDVVAPVAYPQA